MSTLATGRDPNARDNHLGSIPKGGGVAIMIAITGFLTVAGINMTIVTSLVVLTIVSFADDLLSVSPFKRLIVQIIVAVGMASTLNLPMTHHVIPESLEFLVCVGVLVWGMNLTNFMDGIDEITSIHTLTVSTGLVALTVMLPNLHNAMAYDNAIVIAAVLGFWYFNRHPATIFMGDSGSIPLGALTSWFLLSLASQGHWVEALILPAYYVVDSGLTMLSRLLKGYRPWEAHSSHAYQNYVRSNHSHRSAAYLIGASNLAGVLLALATAVKPQHALSYLIAAYALAFLIYLYFRSCRRSFDNAPHISITHATP